MGELGVLFNPGMRHEQEEKRAKQMMREDEGTGRKGRLGIDLDSGTVVIGAERVDGTAADLPEPAESAAERQAVEGAVADYLASADPTADSAAASASAALAHTTDASAPATSARRAPRAGRTARDGAAAEGAGAGRTGAGKAHRGAGHGGASPTPTGKFRRGR